MRLMRLMEAELRLETRCAGRQLDSRDGRQSRGGARGNRWRGQSRPHLRHFLAHALVNARYDPAGSDAGQSTLCHSTTAQTPYSRALARPLSTPVVWHKNWQHVPDLPHPLRHHRRTNRSSSRPLGEPVDVCMCIVWEQAAAWRARWGRSRAAAVATRATWFALPPSLLSLNTQFSW